MFAVAHQLRHGSGLIIAAAIMQMGEHQANHDLGPVIAAEEEERAMQGLMKDMGVQGFAMAVLTHDATEGKAYAIQCAGLGPLTPNTVLMGWPWWWKSNPERCAACTGLSQSDPHNSLPPTRVPRTPYYSVPRTPHYSPELFTS